MNDSYDTSSVEDWLAKLLDKLMVQSIEASYSGSGDEGCRDDISFEMREGAGMRDHEVEGYLESLKKRSASGFSKTFFEILTEQIDNDASDVGNYYDNEGGSVWIKFVVTPDGVGIEHSSYTPGSYDDDECDWDGEEDCEP